MLQNTTQRTSSYSGWTPRLLSISAPGLNVEAEPAPGGIGVSNQSWSLGAGALLTPKRVAPVLNKWLINLDLVYSAAQLLALGVDADFVAHYRFLFGLGNANNVTRYPSGVTDGEIVIEHPAARTAAYQLTTPALPYEMKPTFLIIAIGIVETGDAAHLPSFSTPVQVPLTVYTGARVVEGHGP